MIRFLMVGGFLGAGKTTTLARLARHYIRNGQRVGLVTNDQAYQLVDTHALRHQGFDVGEVPGACFCCKFDDLVTTVRQLSHQRVPDVILAEPVGSCTDLVATVLEPLRQLYGDQFQVGPLAVLLKPEHGLKILSHQQQVGFSPKAAYIFLKQLEEADFVVLNKINKLSDGDRRQLVADIERRYPGKPVLCASARQGSGFPELVELLAGAAPRHAARLPIDYDIYADGEAELGWLNCQVELQATGESRWSLDRAVLALVKQLAGALSTQGLEPAHLKVWGQSGQDAAIANLVSADEPPELSLASEVDVQSAELVVNARVAGAPEQLEQLVHLALTHLADNYPVAAHVSGMQRFRPARPEPTHGHDLT